MKVSRERTHVTAYFTGLLSLFAKRKEQSKVQILLKKKKRKQQNVELAAYFSLMLLPAKLKLGF